MKILKDVLEEVQVSAALRERIRLRDDQHELLENENADLRQKVAELEAQNNQLRSQLPNASSDDLSGDDEQLLVQLFRARVTSDWAPFEEPIAENDVGFIASRLGIDRSVAQYHLDRLEHRGLAVMTGANAAYGHAYWSLTDRGRAYVVEKGLHKQT